MTQLRQCSDGKPCNRVRATVSLESCTTKNDLRDSHLKGKYFEVASHPEAVLEADIPRVSGPFKGELKIHGQKAPVEGTVEISESETKLKFSTKVTNHGIPVPGYLGITVADHVDIEATF